MGELVQNLSDSVEDTKAYKENMLTSLKLVFIEHGLREHAQRHGQISPKFYRLNR